MRLIDADVMEKTILDFWGCDPAYCMDVNGWDPARADVCTLKRLKNAPPVDAVPVVRCKDCKWFGLVGCAIQIVDDTDRPSEDDFCSFGERKGGDE